MAHVVKLSLLMSAGLSVLACAGEDSLPDTPVPSEESEWMALFNGEDLSGWTVKITGSELGEDPFGTFRVENGLMAVGYEDYDTFSDRFGHIFYGAPFSSYQLRVEYRFVGD